MRFRLMSAAVALLLIGAGCRGAKAPSGSDETGAASATLRTIAIERRNQVAAGSECSVAAAVPTLEPQKDLPNDIREDINGALSAATAAAFDVASSSSPEAAAEAWVARCAGDMRGLLSHVQDAPAGLWTNDLAYDVHRNGGRILSLALRGSRYEGGAHPNSAAAPLTFSLATGVRLTLRDLATPGREGALMARLLEQVLRSHGNELFPEQEKEFSDFAQAPTSERGRTLMETYGAFYLTDDSLVLLFNPYDIAPYAAGPIEASVPLADLDGLVRLP